MKRSLIALILAITLTGCGGGGSSVAEESFVSGDGAITFIRADDRKSAPTISGMTLSGNVYTYTKNKVAVVNVWASWCSPCRAEAPTLVALANKYSEVEFIGILTRDNPANAEAFERRFKIPYPTVIDDSILAGFKGSLSANAIPTTVVLDQQGRVAARISGVVTVASLSQLIERVIQG
jgi:thiol-disulfide isomerase/thioredoxin|uniref:TlpA family protein disulfide reductase n=1 Tax=Candidatus Planktophila sp. TaxID=2175601 RepID=UPI00404B8D47